MIEIDRENERRDAMEHVRPYVQECFRHLHQTHRALAWRELEQHCAREAQAQEDVNDREGVPD